MLGETVHGPALAERAALNAGDLEREATERRGGQLVRICHLLGYDSLFLNVYRREGITPCHLRWEPRRGEI
jgi:hypothetical protein